MTFYLIDELEQGTPEWRMWRRGVIGASDAAAIIGENPWSSRQTLLEEKLGIQKEFEGNAITREGQQLEEPARKSLEKLFNHKLSPTVVQDANEPFLAASLDAIDESRNHVYEIKCGVKAFERTYQSRSVPGYYVAQLQHILMVTELKEIVFAVYRPGLSPVTINVKRDNAYIKRLRIAEIEFVSELKARGHQIQYEFRGVRIR